MKTFFKVISFFTSHKKKKRGWGHRVKKMNSGLNAIGTVSKAPENATLVSDQKERVSGQESIKWTSNTKIKVSKSF